MAAQPTTSIYSEDSKKNGSIGIKKPGTMNYQWRPTTRINGVDQFKERNLENTVVSTPQISYKDATINSLPPLHSNSSKKISENGSLATKANMKYLSNSKTTMQQDKVAPITLTNGDNVRNLPPVGVGAGTASDHIGKLAEKMQTTTISTNSKKTTDEGDKIWLPQMDGIDVVLPSSSRTTNQSSSSAATSTTDQMTDEMLKTEEYINSVLYGPRKAKRLPVFEEICPSSWFSETENHH